MRPKFEPLVLDLKPMQVIDYGRNGPVQQPDPRAIKVLSIGVPSSCFPTRFATTHDFSLHAASLSSTDRRTRRCFSSPDATGETVARRSISAGSNDALPRGFPSYASPNSQKPCEAVNRRKYGYFLSQSGQPAAGFLVR